MVSPPLTIEQKVRRSTQSQRSVAARESLKWFFDKIRGEMATGRNRAKSSGRRISERGFDEHDSRPQIGQIYFYQYDAKTKEKLPYWDAFPMVIIINLYDDGWLGLSLHYLPPIGRAKLLDALQKFKKRAGTHRAYMKLSYEMLGAATQSELFAPCVKRYLASHLTSKMVRVEDEFWERAAMLPVQEFQKASARQVWSSGARRKK